MSGLDIPSSRNIAHWEVDQTRTVRFVPGSEKMAKMLITVPSTGSQKQIDVLAVELSELDGVSGSWEMNMASKRGMVTLKTILSDPASYTHAWKVTRQGKPPTTVWTFAKV
jgi:hypothetical protein